MKISVVASEAIPATKKTRLSIAAGQRLRCLAPVLRIRTPAKIEATLAPNEAAVWNGVMPRSCTRLRGEANGGWLADRLARSLRPGAFERFPATQASLTSRGLAADFRSQLEEGVGRIVPEGGIDRFLYDRRSGTGLPLPRQAVGTEVLRRWWLDRYSLDEIRQLRRSFQVDARRRGIGRVVSMVSAAGIVTVPLK